MSDKTEQPTPKRLREAREKGDVCKSQEISAALVVLVLALYLIVMSDTVFTEITALITASFDAIHLPYERALERVSYFAAESFFLIVFPIVFLVMGVALIGNLAQTGFLFSRVCFGKVFESIFQIAGFHRLGLMDGAWRGGKRFADYFLFRFLRHCRFGFSFSKMAVCETAYDEQRRSEARV